MNINHKFLISSHTSINEWDFLKRAHKEINKKADEVSEKKPKKAKKWTELIWPDYK